MLRAQEKQTRVLVVHANSHMRRLITTVLSALPIDFCAEARCAGTAAAQILEHDPDLIIMDMTADPTAALLFAHRLRRGELGRRSTPILGVAQSTHHAVLEHAWEAGIDDVAARPLSALEIMQRAGDLLGAGRRSMAGMQMAGAQTADAHMCRG